jgi:tellurite resistance protein TerC
MDVPSWAWFAFIGAVLVMLAIDLGATNRKKTVITPTEAGRWSLVWISISLAFGIALRFLLGPEKSVQFLTGYVIEWSLAVDNVFVFVLVLASFSVPRNLQHRVIFWGIIGSLVLRAVMIVLGAALVERFHWILYLFGAFLAYTGARMLLNRNADEHEDVTDSPAVKLARRFFPVSRDFHGERFFTVQNGTRMATPLFLALAVIAFSDVIFAVDSIPAIFAITTDPFIVFTSNVLAVLGLRSMFFLLAHMVDRFAYLKVGLAAVLVFVGAKLLLLDVVHLPALVSLGVVLVILASSVVASLVVTAPAQETATD